jgi:hypothetical protein
MGRACSTNLEEVVEEEEEKNAHRSLVGKPERNGPLGRPKRTWVNNIKIDIGKIELGGMDWITLAQGRDQWMALVYTVMKLWVP